MNNKILIAYFMHKGSENPTTKSVAQKVASMLQEKGFESVEYAITPVETYPTKDQELFSEVTKMEKATHYRPALTGKVGKFQDYQNIVLVAPNWHNDFPMAIYTFLDDYDFSGKRLLPIVVHSGDGGKKMREDLRDFIHKVDVLTGVDVPTNSDDTTVIANAVDQLISVINRK